MLAPSNRLTLLDALRPPQGHTFDTAMAITFSLDLRALLAAPAAFALAHTADAPTDDGGMEPVELLHAIRRYADRITVFTQAGQIGLPPSRRVFAFLERSVVSVTAPRGGVVHPKVWIVRYIDEDGTPRLRVLVGSRNLTFDTSWDTMLRLDEDQGGVVLPALPPLFQTMVERAVVEVEDGHRSRVESLCADLAEAAFALPPGATDLSMLVLGLDEVAPPFPTSPTRSLVLSPFVTDRFVHNVLRRAPDELVSRPEQLASLSKSVLNSIGTVYAFDDGSTPELDPAEAAMPVDDPGRPIRGLHAKVFAFEEQGEAQVFCGSANATEQAFKRNVEVLVELRGPIESLGIDALCGGTIEEMGLRQLFHTYVPREDVTDEADDPAGLDALRQRMGEMRIHGIVDTQDGGWTVTYRSTETVELPNGVEGHCWPLGTAGHRKKLLSGAPLDVGFSVSLEGISGFLAVELVAAHHDARTEFVVPVMLDGLPEERDSAVLRLLIGNADRFLRYLLALLSDDPSEAELLDAIDVASNADADRAAAGRVPVLETMVRTLRRDPARLLAIDPLIRDLAADDALPPGFLDLWTELHAAALEVAR